MKKLNTHIRLEERAITLIALVVTIVILLILAGVTITMTLGQNGLFTRAQAGRKEYEQAEVKEDLSMLITQYTWDKVSEKTDKSLGDYLKENGATSVKENSDGQTIEVEYKGYALKVNKDSGEIVEANKGEDQINEEKIDLAQYVGHKVTVKGVDLLVLDVDENDSSIARVTTTNSVGQASTQGYGYTTDESIFIYKDSPFEQAINNWVNTSKLKEKIAKMNVEVKNYDTFNQTKTVELYAYPQTRETISKLFTTYSYGDHYYSNQDLAKMYLFNETAWMCSGDDVYETYIAIFFKDTKDDSNGYDVNTTHVFGLGEKTDIYPVFKLTNIYASEITDNGAYEKTNPYI